MIKIAKDNYGKILKEENIKLRIRFLLKKIIILMILVVVRNGRNRKRYPFQ